MIISEKYAKRDANFELLRIISMVMVLVLHFLSNCNFLDTNEKLPWIIEGICFVAVNCFVMLSGYFMYKSEFKISKIFSLIFQILFYSVVTYFFVVIFLKQPFDLKNFLCSVFPIISGKYWFISNYIVLLLLSPFLNKLIALMNKKEHRNLCVILIFIFSFLSTFFYYSQALKYEKSYDIVWFIVLYFVSSYISKYGINLSISKRISGYIVSTFLIFGSKFFIEYTKNISIFNLFYDLFFEKKSDISYQYSSIFVFLSSVFLILIFEKIKIKKLKIKKLINFTGSLVLTCYLIPKKYIWNFVNPHKMTDNGFLIFIYSVLAILSIFVCCCLIEFARKKLFDFIYNKTDFYNKCSKLQNKIL